MLYGRAVNLTRPSPRAARAVDLQLKLPPASLTEPEMSAEPGGEREKAYQVEGKLNQVTLLKFLGAASLHRTSTHALYVAAIYSAGVTSQHS